MDKIIRVAFEAISRILGIQSGTKYEQDKLRLAGIAIIANVLSKTFAFLVLLYSTRVAITQLGGERFGIWMTISSISVFLGFMDIGIGNALINKVASLGVAKSQEHSNKQLLGASIAVLCMIGIVVSAAISAVFLFVPLDLIFKGLQSSFLTETRITGVMFAVFFGMSLPAQGISKIYIGLHQGWVVHLSSAIAWGVSLLLFKISNYMTRPSIWFYLLSTYGVQQLVGFFLLSGLLKRKLIEFPRKVLLNGFGIIKTDQLFQRGRMFFVIQISVAVVWGSNEIILSSMLGPADAGVFNIGVRAFMAIQVLLSILNAPLWAIYAEAHSENRIDFIQRLLKKSMAGSLALSVIGCALILMCNKTILDLLTGNENTVALSTLILLSVWTIFDICGNAFAMFLNGVGLVRPQVVTGVAYMLFSIPIKVASVYFFGLNGLIMALILSYLFFTVIPFMTIYRFEYVSLLRSGK